MTDTSAPELAPRRWARSLKPWQTGTLVGVVGLAVGVLTLVGQGVVPGDWNHLVNSGAVWLLFAFFAGSLVRSPGWAACAGLETLAGTLVGYYLARFVAYDMSPARGTLLFWVVLALVGGPIFGLAGSWWCDRHRLKQAAGAALLGGVFLAEGADILINIQRMRVAGWVSIGFGVVLPLLLGRSLRGRLFGLLALVPVSVVGFAVYELASWLYLRI